MVLAYLIAVLMTAAGFRVARRLARRTSSQLGDELLRAAAAPVTTGLMLALFTMATLPLGLAEPVQDFLGRAAQAAS